MASFFCKFNYKVLCIKLVENGCNFLCAGIVAVPQQDIGKSWDWITTCTGWDSKSSLIIFKCK